MAKSKLVEANEKISEGVVSGYKKIEEGVVEVTKKRKGQWRMCGLLPSGEIFGEKFRCISCGQIIEGTALFCYTLE